MLLYQYQVCRQVERSLVSIREKALRENGLIDPPKPPELGPLLTPTLWANADSKSTGIRKRAEVRTSLARRSASGGCGRNHSASSRQHDCLGALAIGRTALHESAFWPYCAFQPPSTGSEAPVGLAAASEQKATASAASCSARVNWPAREILKTE